MSEKGQKVYQQANYLPSHPKVPAKQPDLKPGGGRFKRAYYINPDVQYDKGNEWVEYFNNRLHEITTATRGEINPRRESFDFPLKSAGARATRNVAALGAALHF